MLKASETIEHMARLYAMTLAVFEEPIADSRNNRESRQCVFSSFLGTTMSQVFSRHCSSPLSL